MYRFGYNPKEITEHELIPEIIKMREEILSNMEKEKLTLKILALMQGYMENLAFKYSKNSKHTSYEDYMGEMVSAIIDKIPRINVKVDSTGKQIQSFLYYWLNDACQKHYADMEYATNISVSKAKKIKAENNVTEVNAISKTESLNNKVKEKNDEKIEFHETFTSVNRNPIVALYKKELKEIILTKFGAKCYDSFIRLYVEGYSGNSDDRRRLAPFLDYIRNHKELAEMIQEIVESGEGLV